MEQTMIREVGSHVFSGVVKEEGDKVRGLCIVREREPTILCVWRNAETPERVIDHGSDQDAGTHVFDARELAGQRVYVGDSTLIPVLVGAFASFDPPLRAPVTMVSSRDVTKDEGHAAEAEAEMVKMGTGSKRTGVAIADFGQMSRQIFRLVFPELRVARVNSVSYLGFDTSFNLKPVDCVALEPVLYGPRGFQDTALLEKTLLERGDLSRLREMEVLFGCRLYGVSESLARAHDARFARVEALMHESGRSYVENKETNKHRRLQTGRLQNPRDHLKGTLLVAESEMREAAREQGTEIAVGSEFTFRIGSYPPRAWYVHSLSSINRGTSATAVDVMLAPWMQVVLGRGTDYLGDTQGGRSVRAVRGDVVAMYEHSPHPASGHLVGDPRTGVVGELYQSSSAKSWAVLGERPYGYASLDPVVRRIAKQTGRDENGVGRLQSMCYNDPTAITESMCTSRGGVWDAPCTRDHECPYFSEDARGGCVDGYCEMPLGVTNLAFTRAHGVPVCTNCGPANSDPVRCCSELHSPKYAWDDM